MDPARRVLRGDVLVTDGRIVSVGPDLEVPPATRLLEAHGAAVLPGLIQAHVHLGQALFRGLAEDRELLAWLRDRIWPLEAAHDTDSAYWSGMLGAADCLLGGTTTVQEIGLVQEMDAIFRAIDDSGLRAVAGKCLMDTGEGVPSGLLEDTTASLTEAESLARQWHGAAEGRISACVGPRFVLSCSRELWEGTADLSRRLNLPVHTHALESRLEEEAVRAALGTGQMEFLHTTGILDRDLRIAHGVWFGEEHVRILEGRPLKVAHCPSSNLKLGSGIADLIMLRSLEGVDVGLGTDGAPCNNTMDMLHEMRLAALLQQWKQGPGRFTARDALEISTIEGARSVGLESEIGSLEPGKAGDLLVLDLDRVQSFGPDPVSIYDRIVYAAARDAVRWVVVDGEILVEKAELVRIEDREIRSRSTEAHTRLLARANMG